MENKPAMTREQAAVFMLRVQGLHGDKIYRGKEGLVEFTRNAGCVQYDPIDICGKNHELVYHSRIKGFSREALNQVLYEDRRLIDIFDKNMSIAPVEDWPFLDYFRNHFNGSGPHKEEIDRLSGEVLDFINKNGPVCSADIKFDKKVDWFWAPATMSRVVLDTLYYRGMLIVYERRGTRKYYDIPERHLDQKILDSGNPFKDRKSSVSHHILRRIKSVGLLWNRPSDAFLGIHGLKASERNQAFEKLVAEGDILEARVTGIDIPLFFWSGYENAFGEVMDGSLESTRMEFIAPLDNMMWDRRLIKEIFGFDYKWEIYTPEAKRKYGYYVLPVLNGNKFIGRIEIVKDKQVGRLKVKNLWFEDSSSDTLSINSEIDRCLSCLNSFYYE